MGVCSFKIQAALKLESDLLMKRDLSKIHSEFHPCSLVFIEVEKWIQILIQNLLKEDKDLCFVFTHLLIDQICTTLIEMEIYSC